MKTKFAKHLMAAPGIRVKGGAREYAKVFIVSQRGGVAAGNAGGPAAERLMQNPMKPYPQLLPLAEVGRGTDTVLNAQSSRSRAPRSQGTHRSFCSYVPQPSSSLPFLLLFAIAAVSIFLSARIALDFAASIPQPAATPIPAPQLAHGR